MYLPQPHDRIRNPRLEQPGGCPRRVYINEPEPPNHGLIWKQGQSSGIVRATICANGGYPDLYPDNLAALDKRYKLSHP